MTRTQELHDRIIDGLATTDEIEEYLGPDLVNAGVHRLRGEADSRYAFLDWYQAVIEPIQLDKVAAWRMFSGQLSIDDYAANLTDKLKLTPAAQYFWDYDLIDGNDAWTAGVTLDYKIAEGLAFKTTANYFDEDAADDGLWTGFVRLQRSF